MQRLLLLILFATSISFQITAQWQPCLGLEGGRTGNIVKSDSFLLATSNNIIYRTNEDFSSPWVKTSGYGTGLLVVDSCIVSYAHSWVQRSFDNGTTWEYVPGISETWSMCTSGNTIFYGYGGSGMLMKSSNYLDSVEYVTLLPNIAIMQLSSYDSIIIASDYFLDGIYQSADSGNHWEEVTLVGLPTEQVQNCDNAFFNSTLWVSGSYGVYFLNSDSTEWIEANSGIPANKKVLCMNTYNSAFYCSVEYSGLYKLDLNDTSWHYVDGSPKYFWNMSNINDDLYFGSYRGPSKMDSSGNWLNNYEGLYHRDVTSSSRIGDTNFVFANYDLFKSNEDGTVFEKFGDIDGTQIITTDSVFYAVSNSDIMISHDFGHSWDTITNGMEIGLSHLSITDNYYFISSRQGLFRSPVDNITWTKMENSIDSWNYVSYEAMDSVVIANDGNSRLVYMSKDHGITFDTLFETVHWSVPIQKIANRFYILNADQILFSDDLGENWGNYYTDHPFKISNNLFQDEEILVVGGDYTANYGPYLSMSYDEGQTWQGIEDSIITQYQGYYGSIDYFNKKLFVASRDNSLWYREDILTDISKPIVNNIDYLNIYPNPANDIITLEADNYTLTDEYYIFDISGRELVNGKISDRRTEINISVLESGIYIIKLQRNSVVTSKKIIKY